MSEAALDDELAALDMNKTLKTCGARDTRRNAAKIFDEATSAFVDDTVESTVTTVAAATAAGNALVDDTLDDSEMCVADTDLECVAQMDADAAHESDEEVEKTKATKSSRRTAALIAALDAAPNVVIVHGAEEDVFANEIDDNDDDETELAEPSGKKRAVADGNDTPVHIAQKQDSERAGVLDKQHDLLASVKTQESREKQKEALERYVSVVLFDHYNGQRASQTNPNSLFGTLCAHAAAGERETMTKKKRLLAWKPQDVLDSLMYIIGTIDAALSVARQCDAANFRRCVDLLLGVETVETNQDATRDLSSDEKRAPSKCHLLDRDMKMDDTRQLVLQGASVSRRVFVCRRLVSFVHAVHMLRTLTRFVCVWAEARQKQLARKIKPGQTTWSDAIDALVSDRAKKTNLMDRTCNKLYGALQVLYQSGELFDKARQTADVFEAQCLVEEQRRRTATEPMVEDDDDDGGAAVSEDDLI